MYKRDLYNDSRMHIFACENIESLFGERFSGKLIAAEAPEGVLCTYSPSVIHRTASSRGVSVWTSGSMGSLQKTSPVRATSQECVMASM